MWIMWDTREECYAHSILAPKNYKRTNNKTCLKFHWNLCKKCEVRLDKCQIESVIENDIVQILCGVCIQMDRQIEHRRPDIVIIKKATSEC